MATVFNVTMDLESMRDKGVLVFLRPVSTERDLLIHAWQVLIASASATGSFAYNPVISTNVFSRRDPTHYLLSETREVQPGSLLEAVNTDGPSPRLDMAPDNLAREILAPQQAGVINSTNPSIKLDCTWLVSNKPVATVLNLGEGDSCAFEYEPSLYFMVGRPPLVGQTYNVQDFTNMTRYPIPVTYTEVYVNVRSGVEGHWDFTFSERV